MLLAPFPDEVRFSSFDPAFSSGLRSVPRWGFTLWREIDPVLRFRVRKEEQAPQPTIPIP